MRISEQVLADLNTVVEKYGLEAVRHTLTFIEGFPMVYSHATTPFETASYYTTLGTLVKVNRQEFEELRRIYANGLNKIQAIKRLREMTSIGLKEAKDTIEFWDQHLRF